MTLTPEQLADIQGNCRSYTYEAAKALQSRVEKLEGALEALIPAATLTAPQITAAAVEAAVVRARSALKGDTK